MAISFFNSAKVRKTDLAAKVGVRIVYYETLIIVY